MGWSLDESDCMHRGRKVFDEFDGGRQIIIYMSFIINQYIHNNAIL